jgi:16S rRNA (cytidine1402-2'-O)-methyltransferase
MEYQGKLYIVGLPIGNMEDITLRAIKTLQQCEVILCEDTRQFKKIAQAYGISGKLIAYHSYNEHDNSTIIEMLKTQKIAIVSDRGMPLVSDPGFVLIRECWQKCPSVIEIIPGVSALTTAFSLSAFCNRCCFLGFLTSKDWSKISGIPYSLVIFESPHRIQKTLDRLYSILGDRKVLICREMTKLHQEITLSSLKTTVNATGEFTLVVSPAE